MQWLFLVGSLVVLTTAVVLRVDGAGGVVVPVLNLPVPTICTFQRLFHLDCPGCGMTRSFINLADGDLRGAWHHNPIAFLLFPVVVVQIPYRVLQLWRYSRGLPLYDASNFVWICWLLVPVLAAHWIFKFL